MRLRGLRRVWACTRFLWREAADGIFAAVAIIGIRHFPPAAPTNAISGMRAGGRGHHRFFLPDKSPFWGEPDIWWMRSRVHRGLTGVAPSLGHCRHAHRCRRYRRLGPLQSQTRTASEMTLIARNRDLGR